MTSTQRNLKRRLTTKVKQGNYKTGVGEPSASRLPDKLIWPVGQFINIKNFS